jgi:hypothetical protein
VGRGALPQGRDYAFAAVPRPWRISQFNGHTVEKIWCAGDCSFAWTRGGMLYSWGSNSFGQLGQGHARDVVPSPRAVVGLDGRKLALLACGGYHTLAVAGGHTWAWGRGLHGQLGTGQFIGSQTVPRLVMVLALEGATPMALACGDNHSAAVTDAHKLYTWGCNMYGQLGHGAPMRMSGGDPNWGKARPKTADARPRRRRPRPVSASTSFAELEQQYASRGGSLGARLSASKMCARPDQRAVAVAPRPLLKRARRGGTGCCTTTRCKSQARRRVGRG